MRGGEDEGKWGSMGGGGVGDGEEGGEGGGVHHHRPPPPPSQALTQPPAKKRKFSFESSDESDDGAIPRAKKPKPPAPPHPRPAYEGRPHPQTRQPPQGRHRPPPPPPTIAECQFVDEVSHRIGGLGLCTRTCVQLISRVQLNYQLLGQLIDELLVTLQLAGCISGVASCHLASLSTDADLRMGVLTCGKIGHGRLRLGHRAFHALLGGGVLAFERGGWPEHSPQSPKVHLACKGGGGAKGQGSSFTPSKSSLDPHSAISINNAQHSRQNLDPLG